jgi:membrane protein implicated in regulation of membrane protease activity
MTTGWIVAIGVVVVATVALLSFRDHRSRADRPPTRPSGDAGPAPTIAEAREAARLEHMSAEDRDWEAASLQRQRARDAVRDPAPEAH